MCCRMSPTHRRYISEVSIIAGSWRITEEQAAAAAGSVVVIVTVRVNTWRCRRCRAVKMHAWTSSARSLPLPQDCTDVTRSARYGPLLDVTARAIWGKHLILESTPVRIHRMKWRHRIYGHDTIAILWVWNAVMSGDKGRRFIVLFK